MLFRSKGEFSLRVDTHGLPQQVSMKGYKIKARGGPWNGLCFSGYLWLRPNPIFEYEFVLNGTELYYEYTLVNGSVFPRLVFYPSGVWGRLIWRDQTHSWEIYSTSQVDQCENYAYCDAYATMQCQSLSSMCMFTRICIQISKKLEFSRLV